jgi:sulfate adenylyltransferase subunit 2
MGEHFRIFPISNWTEMDVWQYILHEKIELPSLYFSHKREVVNRNGVLLGKCDYIQLKDNEQWEERTIRCRTIGDMTCTGVAESDACTLEEIIEEVASTRVTERGGRADDKRSEAAMEDRKKEGYF